MTEFKAPPPPPENFTTPSASGVGQTPASQPAQVAEATSPEQPAETTVNSGANAAFNETMNKLQNQKEVLQQKFNALPSNKKQVLIATGIFVLGLLMGAIMFGGSSEAPAPVVQGLKGVVSNPDIKERMKRCGQVEASAACILYIMNSAQYEKLAKDFFETATAVTGRTTTIIGWDNVRYGGLKIPPGYFAEIKIPARQ